MFRLYIIQLTEICLFTFSSITSGFGLYIIAIENNNPFMLALPLAVFVSVSILLIMFSCHAMVFRRLAGLESRAIGFPLILGCFIYCSLFSAVYWSKSFQFTTMQAETILDTLLSYSINYFKSLSTFYYDDSLIEAPHELPDALLLPIAISLSIEITRLAVSSMNVMIRPTPSKDKLAEIAAKRLNIPSPNTIALVRSFLKNSTHIHSRPSLETIRQHIFHYDGFSFLIVPSIDDTHDESDFNCDTHSAASLFVELELVRPVSNINQSAWRSIWRFDKSYWEMIECISCRVETLKLNVASERNYTSGRQIFVFSLFGLFTRHIQVRKLNDRFFATARACVKIANGNARVSGLTLYYFPDSLMVHSLLFVLDESN